MGTKVKAKIRVGDKVRPYSVNRIDGRLIIVQMVYAPYHRRWFYIARRPHHRTDFVVEAINKNGTHSKRQVRGLWDRQFATQTDAKRAIDQWDLKAMSAKAMREIRVGEPLTYDIAERGMTVRTNPQGNYPRQGGGGTLIGIITYFDYGDDHGIWVDWDGVEGSNCYNPEDLILVGYPS